MITEDMKQDFLESKSYVDSAIRKIINKNCILILVDKVGDTYTQIYKGPDKAIVADAQGNKVQIAVPDSYKQRHQTGIGSATILKLYEADDDVDVESVDDRMLLLKVGDRVAFNPGTPIGQAIFHNNRIQILHVNNVLWLSGESIPT